MRNYLLILLAASCVAREPVDGRDDTFVSDGKSDVGGIADGSPEALGVLAVVNSVSEAQLESDVGLSSAAASGIADHGPTFQSLAELDAVPYVGRIAFDKLLAYARANGFVGDQPSVGRGILLDCNTSLGPDQQVTVIGDGTTLTLRELTSSGAQIDRPLATAEWASEKLQLRDDFGSHATLTKESGSWIARSFGGGFDETGDADCWVDQSR